MMLFVLLVLCLVFGAFCMKRLLSGQNVFQTIIFDLILFWGVYTVVSAFFFLFDCFDFLKVMISCVAILGILSVYLFSAGIRSMQSPSEPFAVYAKRYWPVLVISALALIFTWQKFELYSMGQDQGTYQVKALQLMSGDTHNYIELSEFQKLSSMEDKQKYLDFVYAQNNLYLPRVEAETDYDASHFETIRGTIHGLPTYAALLALWGSIFGMQHMLDVQTFLFLCLIWMTWFVCENLSFKRKTSVMITLLSTFSPIIIWLSKSSLTEIGLALLICVLLYFLSAKHSAYYCLFPISIFAFFHISLYAFMPIIVLVFWVRYFYENRKAWLWISFLATLLYALSSYWAFYIEPYYAIGNYTDLIKLTKGILTKEMLTPIITGAVFLIGILCIVLQKKRERIASFFQKRSVQNGWFGIVRVFLLLSFLFFVYKGILQADTKTACEYLQISTYIYMSGIFAIPILYVALVIKPAFFFENVHKTTFSLLFLYCIVMYSMVMRIRVPFYYYYARYAALFITLIFIMLGFLLESARASLAMLAWVTMLCTFAPYDGGLIVEKDHTRCEWSYLSNLVGHIKDNAAFVVGPDELQIVYIMPVKFLTGCDVYHADYDHLDEELSALADAYDYVYYLDYDSDFEEQYAKSDVLAMDGIQKVFSEPSKLSYLDYFNIDNPFTPIPLHYVEYQLQLSLYEIH